jgi:tripartite-type tricarboxylate transporter receptor subunit TctC
MPVAQFGNSLNVVYVHPSFPANDMRQLVDMIRKAPNRYLYASPGNGTTPHLMMEMLKTRLQLPVSHVPFKGSPGATTAVVGGELQIGVDAVGATMSLIRSGKLKALAVTGNRRFAGLPDVPTLEEAGMGVNVPSTYLGIYAPAGVAPAIVARLAGEVESSLKRPEVLKRLESLGVQPEYRGPSAFKARVDQDRALWGEAVKVSGAKVD